MRTALGIILLLVLCATTASAQTPAHFWSQRFGSTLTDAGEDVAVDGSGNVFVAGSFSGTVDFGGGPLTSAGGTDIFLAKYNSNGALQWSQRFGSTGGETALALTVDGAGSVVMVGQFNLTVDFGGGPLVSAGGTDVFVAKYTSSGTHQWSQRFGSTSADAAQSVTVDGSNNVIVAGSFALTVDFGGGPLASAGGLDIFLAKYNSSGTHQWSQRYGSTVTDVCSGVASDGVNAVITGYFTGTVDFGGGPLASAGSTDIFLAKYNSAGVHQWSKRFGSTSSDVGYNVAADGSGNIVMAGRFVGTVDFGGGSLVSAGSTDIVLAKYNSAGTHQWSKRFGGASSDEGLDVALSASGSVFVTGFCSFNVDFGGGPHTASIEDIFLAKYNSSGIHQWSQIFGSTDLDHGNGVAVDAAGNAFMTGQFRETVNFGGGVLNAVGPGDIIIAKYGVDVAEPDITAIADVGNDQGRRVRISFGHSGQDMAGATVPITHYEAFRRVDPLPALLGGRTTLATGWDPVADIRAHGDNAYEIVVETLADSTVAAGMYRSVFYIRASTDLPQTFYDSVADSGYSVDNLAPSAPSNFVLAASVLSWKESKAPDFDYFSVYGSTSNVFDVNAVLIDQIINTSLNVSASPHTFYYITATDFSGNEGKAARANAASDVGGTARYVLGVNAYPNPFNPATTIRYDVPSRGRVVVSVYDTKGERVATLVDENRDAGSYPVRWDGVDARGTRVGSGVYFVRLQFGAETRSRKIVLLK
jgi:hypothetical protein